MKTLAIASISLAILTSVCYQYFFHHGWTVSICFGAAAGILMALFAIPHIDNNS